MRRPSVGDIRRTAQARSVGLDVSWHACTGRSTDCMLEGCSIPTWSFVSPPAPPFPGNMRAEIMAITEDARGSMTLIFARGSEVKS